MKFDFVPEGDAESRVERQIRRSASLLSSEAADVGVKVIFGVGMNEIEPIPCRKIDIFAGF